MASCRRWALLLAVAVEAACGSMSENAGEERVGVESELRALYSDFSGEVRYFDGTSDLNRDGKPETIVYVVSPMLCGTGGCETLVFTPSASGYELVARISVSRPPIQVASRSSNGWYNLLVHVEGGGILPGYDAELQFDGKAYPSNPTVPPVKRAPDTEGGEIVVPEFEQFTDGKLLVLR